MDLPPDKAKLLRNYDLEKKWEIICDQDMVQAKDSPAHYLNRLRTYLDPKASRSHRVRRHFPASFCTVPYLRWGKRNPYKATCSVRCYWTLFKE